MSTLYLPKETRNLVDQYLNLNIAGKKVRCPYYQNFSHKSGKPVDVGKGLPQEIEKKTDYLFINLGKNLKKLEPQQIRQCMVMVGIGIDCSGLVVRILDSYISTLNLKKLSSSIKPKSNNILDIARHKLKFTTNVSANLLTSDKNCIKVKVRDILPSDLIRFGKGHVAIVTEVTKSNNVVRKIKYCHSTYDYLEESGVKFGEILVTNENKPLDKQRWLEEQNGTNWTLNDYLNNKINDRGVRRLRSFV